MLFWIRYFIFFLGLSSLSLGEEVGMTLVDFGEKIFFDDSLSDPAGQGCFSCHSPRHAFSDGRAVSPGAVLGEVGVRNAPSLMYAALIPSRKLEDTYDEAGEVEYIVEGGFFHDGRAHDLREQVSQPFFTKHEMNLPNESALAAKLRAAGYAGFLKTKLSEGELVDDEKVCELAFDALVAFLREPVFRPFNARIDQYWAGDKDALSLAEKRGMDLFRTSAGCADCHLMGASEWLEPLLSDYGFDNLGVPKRGKADPGLGGVTGLEEELGQFKVPSLRNVALTAPYFHNGSVGSLKEVMEFYNKRDVEPERWGETDYPATVNREDMGDLELSEQDVADLVAFMHTFTDQHLEGLEKERELPEVPAGVPSTEERKAFFQPKWRFDLSQPRRPRESSDE